MHDGDLIWIRGSIYQRHTHEKLEKYHFGANFPKAPRENRGSCQCFFQRIWSTVECRDAETSQQEAELWA